MIKKAILNILFLLLPTLLMAWPVSVPNVGGRIKVVSQNCKYYYVVSYTDASLSCDYHTEVDMRKKTENLANSLVYMDADIYALQEVEPNDSVLHYLANEMNDIAGDDLYSYIKDGLQGDYAKYQNIKSGYIYRKDKIAPYRGSTSPYSSGAYKLRMRIQTFEEISTGEKFTLSVNHFKSKSGDTDGSSQSARNTNASNLISKLNTLYYDPDILVVGDLNETTSEPAVQSLVNAGYAEQLERYDTNAYSYYYNRSYSLLDHILANSTMASQVTGAGVFHINTYYNRGYAAERYSDHDPVMVGINLGSTSAIHETQLQPARKVLINGKLYIITTNTIFTPDGRSCERQKAKHL